LNRELRLEGGVNPSVSTTVLKNSSGIFLTVEAASSNAALISYNVKRMIKTTSNEGFWEVKIACK
jgi:hypothetical protein